ncbi:uncharacterized protein LOC128672290 [Plodia interpunctella]|uniref:uncharacterized protein LOC128672290 n=1 Tax=Plodia interpunctella TaxID=58824 RepID=UPI002368946A|nr:uncharacterized protein LOC128672290 [Plodia interpunctella]
MKVVVYLLMLGFSGVTPDWIGECDMAPFYEELGCSPMHPFYKTSVCPLAYKCPDLHPDPNMCYYKGVPYKDGSSIPDAEILNPCTKACSCQVKEGVRFNCAMVDCVQSFDIDLQTPCVRTYELWSCCTTGTVCGEDAVANLKTCKVDGKTYREGETFEPINTRKTCVCTGDWNGTIVDTYCRDINCGLEIHDQDKLAKKCAPVFVRNTRGCPFGFECQSPTSKVVPGLNSLGVNVECAFGNMTLRVGDEVTVDDACMKCTCTMPPFVSCIIDLFCDNDEKEKTDNVYY